MKNFTKMKSWDILKKDLFPNSEKLIVNKEGVKTTIIDAELDPVSLYFSHKNFVEINTEEYSHICLGKDDLYKIIELMDEAEESYKLKFLK